MKVSELLKGEIEYKYYRKPSNFVRHVIGMEPSIDQANYIDDMADLTISRAIITAPRSVGKTISQAFLATWSVSELPKILGQPYKVCVLGGKYRQAEILHEACASWFLNIPYLRDKLKKDPIKGHIVLKDGSEIIAVAASDRSVHGPHSDCLIIDEAVDAKDELIEESFCIISQSKYPRLILTSTPYRYFSYFVNVWREAKKLGYKKFHYKQQNCPWLNRQEFEHAKKNWSEDRFRIHWLGLPTVYTSIVFEPELLHQALLEEMPDTTVGDRTVMGIDFGYGPSPTAVVLCQLQEGVWNVIFAEEYSRKAPDWIQSKIKEIARQFNVQDIFGDAQAKSEIMRLRDVGVPVRSIAFQYKRETDMIPKVIRLLREKRLKIPEQFDNLLKQMGEMVYTTSRVSDKVTSKRAGVDLVDALLLALTTQEMERSKFGIVVDSYA